MVSVILRNFRRLNLFHGFSSLDGGFPRGSDSSEWLEAGSKIRCGVDGLVPYFHSIRFALRAQRLR